MTKGRITTWQERIDIVLYCLANGQDYTKAASHFHVSYQQVYSWVKKYEAGGEEALRDGRGRTKAPELTEADRHRLAMQNIDNGPMESFWGTLKCEKYYLHTYRTFEELQQDIDEYIHFYNYERLQAKLNGPSPIEFRTKAA